MITKNIKPILSDYYGNPITTLTQWDSNVTLYINNWEYDSAPIIHFLDRPETKSCTIETQLEEIDGNKRVVLSVPNIMLQGCSPIIMFIALQRNKQNTSLGIEEIEIDNNTEIIVLYKEEIKVQRRKQPDDYIYVETVEFVQLSTVLNKLNEAIVEFNSKSEEIQEYMDDFERRAEEGEFDGKDGKDGVDGKDGKDGTDGQDGADGFSPIVTITANDNILTFQVIDATGTKSATLTAGTGISITNGVIAATLGWSIVVDTELPVTGQGQTFYFISKTDPEQGDIYDEYIWINNDFEYIGSTSIDLSNYLSKDEAERLYQKKLIAGDCIDITNNVISAKGIKYLVEYTVVESSGQLQVTACNRQFSDILAAYNQGYNIIATATINNVILEFQLMSCFEDSNTGEITFGLTAGQGNLIITHYNDNTYGIEQLAYLSQNDIAQNTGNNQETVMSQDATTRKLGTKIDISQGSTNANKLVATDSNGDIKTFTDVPTLTGRQPLDLSSGTENSPIVLNTINPGVYDVKNSGWIGAVSPDTNRKREVPTGSLLFTNGTYTLFFDTYDFGYYIDNAGIIYTDWNTGVLVNYKAMIDALAEFQPLLISGTNIKTLNNESLLGSGNIDIKTTTEVVII